MATQAILVEDCSPMIQYAPEGAWQDAQLNDSLAASYSGGSYHATSTQGATATIQFRGTGFSITGGRRPGYGPFSLSVDGQQLFNGSPAPGPSPINNTLASVSGLPNDVHTVVLTNTGTSLIDIDTISFQPQVGSAGSTPSVTTYDDSDSRINYLPSASTWSLNPRPEFQGGTLHYSQAPDAAASLQFTGNAVGIYGTVSPDHADLSISIDGKTVTLPNKSGSDVVVVRPQVLLYWAGGLDDGQHTVTVSKAQNPDAGPFIDIDSFVVYSAAQSSAIASNPSSGSTSGTGSPASASVASKHDSVSRTGIIVGASAAGAVALILILAGAFFWLKRRRRQKVSTFTKESISPVTPILPMQGMAEVGQVRGKPVSAGGENPAFPFPPLTSVKSKPKRSSKLSIAPSYYGDSELSSSNAYDRYPRPTSSESSDPLVPSVPRLAMPRMPPSARTVPAVVVTDTDWSRPLRPQRPPTLNIGSLQ